MSLVFHAILAHFFESNGFIPIHKVDPMILHLPKLALLKASLSGHIHRQIQREYPYLSV